MKHHLYILPILCGVLTAVSEAKVDLVTLPKRDTVQLTIYNSADLTLVRESRELTLEEGLNRLQFSWENTLIDPTSLEMLPKAGADRIDVLGLTYPPRVRNLGVWTIRSESGGQVPMGIHYLTSGLSWRAFYLGTLSPDEATMRLQGYVRVSNNSGEDYENAQTRLVVGKVHMIDEIAALAQREHPYGTPQGVVGLSELRRGRRPPAPAMAMRAEAEMAFDSVAMAPKEIVKEGLSEYFLYTIAGTETIRHGWSKRLPSFESDDVPVVNLYKFEEARYGSQVLRFLSFKNDEAHRLGETPIPGGTLRVYRDTGEEGHLSYEGQSSFQYIPVDEDVELNLGAVEDVIVEPALMDYRTDQFLFNRDGNIDGWDEIREFKLEIKNTRARPIKVEIKRNFGTTHWDLEPGKGHGRYEQVDLDTVKFTLELAPRQTREFSYVLTTRHGRRAE